MSSLFSLSKRGHANHKTRFSLRFGKQSREKKHSAKWNTEHRDMYRRPPLVRDEGRASRARERFVLSRIAGPVPGNVREEGRESKGTPRAGENEKRETVGRPSSLDVHLSRGGAVGRRVPYSVRYTHLCDTIMQYNREYNYGSRKKS